MKYESFPYMLIIGTPNKRVSLFFKTPEELDHFIGLCSKDVKHCFIHLYKDNGEGYTLTRIMKKLEVKNESFNGYEL